MTLRPKKSIKSKRKKSSNKSPTKVSQLLNTVAAESKKAWGKTSDMIADVTKSTAEESKRIWGKASGIISETATSATKSSKKVLDQTTVSLKEAAKKGKGIFQDDVERLKNECALLNQWTLPTVPQPVVHSAILAAAGTGVLFNEDNLIQLTSWMDSKNSIFEKILELFFDRADIEQVSKWIDTIPGANFVGGGVTHRITHGHDINALVDLFQSHDLAGVFEWFNHIVLQDFWTSAGIPFLPFGNNSAFEWLKSLGFGPEVAADLLSVNSAEVIAVLMLYRGSKFFIKFIQDQIREKKAKELWNRAIELNKLGDFSAANKCFDLVLSYVPDKPEIAIWTSMNYLRCAQQNDMKEDRTSNLFRAYQLADSVRLKLLKDKSIPYYGGIRLSLRGLATTIMASSCICILGKDNINAIKGIIASGVEDLIKMSNSLNQHLNLRPFSAIANEALALNLLTASPFALSSVHTPLTMHNRINESLQKLSMEKDLEGEYAKKLLVGFNKKYPLKSTPQIMHS